MFVYPVGWNDGDPLTHSFFFSLSFVWSSFSSCFCVHHCVIVCMAPLPPPSSATSGPQSAQPIAGHHNRTNSLSQISLAPDHIYSLDINDYNIGQVIGTPIPFVISRTEKDWRENIGYGSSAIVHAATYIPLDKEVAVKMIELDRFESNQIEELRVSGKYRTHYNATSYAHILETVRGAGITYLAVIRARSIQAWCQRESAKTLPLENRSLVIRLDDYRHSTWYSPHII